MKMSIIGVLVATMISGCYQVLSHKDIVAEELNKVSYENGIAITEAKAIADAYLYVYAQHIGPAAFVRIRDGGETWEGDVFAGVGISPKAANAGPVRVDKTTGAVNWDQGPSVARVDVNTKYTASAQ